MRITFEEAGKMADQLLDQMTVEEMVEQLSYRSPAIERLGLPSYTWWNEALHGVARAGTATVFPQAIGLAAMFDEKRLEKISDIIATEGRAKYNSYVKKHDRGMYKGLTFWSPNINIFRDPRWGRGHETYGEDPYLTSRLGAAFINGLQGKRRYLKGAACAKHFAVHSGPEALRHEFDVKVSKKDLYETYLPAFEACVKEAEVEAVMGAYNRVNGKPCCGSEEMLHGILRKQWGFQGHVVSDCGAIADFHEHHMVTDTPQESAALAINSGCDLNCGSVYLHGMAAVRNGLISNETVRMSAKRLLTTRIRLGMLDEACEFNQIPYEENDSPAHHAASLEAARKSMVLLKNSGILPLHKALLPSIAVIGPNADSRSMLMGNYCGTASETVTVLDGIQRAVGKESRIYYAMGCHLFQDQAEGGLSEAVAAAEQADVTILCLGYDSSIEGESGDANNSYAAGDRQDIGLPGRQQELLEAVIATGKPVIVVYGTGSGISLRGLESRCAAILCAWYPGSLGGIAVADILFGVCSPGGKLPITFYKDAGTLPDFADYSMKNRTYRFLEEEALYPFGYGLTYSNVLSKRIVMQESASSDFTEIEISLELMNMGPRDVEEVAQCYVKDLESELAVRNYSLAAFKRVEIPAGETKTVKMTLNRKAFLAVDEEGNTVLDSRKFRIYAGTSQPDEVSVRLTGHKPLEKELFVL